jgi:hypothetical protein
MKYHYEHLKLCVGRGVLSRIDEAAGRLHEKLLRIDPGIVGISEYNQRYLSRALANPVGILQRYGYLLALALEIVERPWEDAVLVDYGGGSGLLSLLAKEAGIGRVFYNDIYDVSCEDAEKLGKAIGLKAQDYVRGEIDDLILYIQRTGTGIDAIASYDVIEHIYDIRAWIQKTANLSKRAFRMVHASGANARNPLLRRRIQKRQWQFEYQDREKVPGWKERDCLKSYLEVRREIIAQHAPLLTESVARKLAAITRGLRKEDIEKVVDEYLIEGDTAYRPDHPTNTCDPHTGNWAEHLMDPCRLESVLNEAGFRVMVLNGYWPYYKAFHKRLAANLLNVPIQWFQTRALCLSPYFVTSGVLCADREILF